MIVPYSPAEFEWKRTSFGRMRRVPAYEAARWKHQRSPSKRNWVERESDRLVKLMEQGHTRASAAKKIGRTYVSVRKYMDAHKLTPASKRTALYSINRLEILIGRAAETIKKWITLGYMKVTHAPGTRRWYVFYDDLVDFFHNPQYWCLWQVKSIKDLAMRRELMNLRQNEPKWYKYAEIATKYSVSQKTVERWVQTGLLPAFHRFVHARDLIGFVPPCERKR